MLVATLTYRSVSCGHTVAVLTVTCTCTGHFTLWISLSLSPNILYTQRPEGVNYHRYLHDLKYLLFIIIILIEKGVMQIADK